MNFRNIRIYGHEYEPEFFKGAGIRGWWLRVLNRIRLSLELRCQFHAMMLLGRLQGVDTEKLGKQVRRDQQKIVDYIQESEEYRALATATPTRILKAEEMASERTKKSLARLTAQGRSRRYTRGRFTFPVYEAEAYPNESGTAEIAASSEVGTSESEAEGHGRESHEEDVETATS